MRDARSEAKISSYRWSPLLATALEFESGAVLQAIIGFHDPKTGDANWRVTRHCLDNRSAIGGGKAIDLDSAVSAVSAFIGCWKRDGAVVRVVPARDL